MHFVGFAGYFNMTLYKDVCLATEPSTKKPDLFSWYYHCLPSLVVYSSGIKVEILIDVTKEEFDKHLMKMFPFNLIEKFVRDLLRGKVPLRYWVMLQNQIQP